MELQQQLMELVYDLLDEDEAKALYERITSDPEVARAYAKVKLQCDLVAEAARCDTPPVSWTRPNEVESPSSVPVRSTTGSHKLANWCLGLAASALICLVGSNQLMTRFARSEATPVSIATPMPLQVALTGPSKLNSEAPSPFTIQVASAAGTPVSTTLHYHVYDANGAVSWDEMASTDESGVGHFEVDPAVTRSASRLEILTADRSPTSLLRELEVAPERFVTYLRLDRPLYQPGDQVFYRSVTLSQFGLRSEREMTTSFEFVNSDGEQLGPVKVVNTEYGVGSGTFELASDLPDGTYTLIARSPDNLFREEWREFQVRRYSPPRLLKKLDLVQDSYTAGDQVDLDFSVARVAGEPVAEVLLQIQATLDGLPLDTPEVKTDKEGKSRFSLVLPETIDRGQGRVSVTVRVGDEPGETISKDIPINLGRVNVDFFPEGGELAAELPSRVYFYGRDPLGKPVHIEGRIVDSAGQEVAQVATMHEGRGVFAMTPAADESYRLMIEKPVGVTKEIPLPAASPACFATVQTGKGVFDSMETIPFTLFQSLPVKQVVVAAYCRGAMVGQQSIEPLDYDVQNTKFAEFRDELPLSAEAQGVIRLTVFDATRSPPEPIAERLVYRRIGRKLDVQLAPDAQTFAPGQAVQLDLAVQDERGSPVPAVLGIAIVDDAVLNLADDKSIRMPTYFHLLTEIASPEQLEDANFYLSDEPESGPALDTLLGTQGWRRFMELPATQLAQKSGGFGGGGEAAPMLQQLNRSLRFRSLPWADETALPLTTTATIENTAAAVSTGLARAAPSYGKAFAWSMVAAGVALLVIVGITSLRWARSNRRLRVFSVVIAVGSLLVGTFSLPIHAPRAARSGSVVEFSEQSEVAATAEDIVDEQSYVESGSFMFQSEREELPADMPQSARLESAPSPGAPNFTPPRMQTDSRVDAIDAEEAIERLPEAGKKAVADSSRPAPRPFVAEPSLPQPEAGALKQQTLQHAEQTRSSPELERRILGREFADWFYDSRSNSPQSDRSSSTIFWHPRFLADETTGAATVYFSLPRRASSFRAIVEAHGAARLGAGELVIDSRDP